MSWVFLWGEKMPLPTPADFRDRTKKHSQVRELLAQLAENVLGLDVANANALFAPVTLANNANINTLETGLYHIPSDSVAATITGMPPELGTPRRGFLFVFRKTTTSYQKFIRDSSDIIESYERTGNGIHYTLEGFAWKNWVRTIDSSFLTALENAIKNWVIDSRESTLKFTNFFSEDEIKGDDFSRIMPIANKSLIMQFGQNIKMTCNPSTSSFTEFRWRFSTAHFKNKRISASAKVLSATAGTGSVASATRFRVSQTNSSGATIKTEFFIIGNESAITSEKVAKLENITLDPSAIYVDVGFEFLGLVARDLVVTDLFVSDTEKADFIRNKAKQSNLFPDHFFSAKYANVWGATSITQENGAPVLNFESSSLNQVLYRFPAQGPFKPGAILNLKANIFANTAGPSVLLIFYNDVGTELGRVEKASALANAWESVGVEQVIPNNTYSIGLRLTKYATSTSAKFKDVILTSTNNAKDLANEFPLTVLHVDAQNGDDKNIGTWNSPLKSLASAMMMATPNTKIVLQEGDYTDCPAIKSSVLSLEVVAARNAKVRIIGGTKLSSFTKVDGKTKVWRTAVTSNPGSTTTGQWLYQHGIAEPDTLIQINERSKYHEGRTHRLQDFARIWHVNSIDEIEAATKPSWFWLDGVMYLSCVDFADPNLADIRIPDNVNSPFYTSGTTKDQYLGLVGIESFYWLNGFRTWDFSVVEMDRCRAFGNKSNGFEHSNSMFVRRTACEAAGNWVDGTGGHMHTMQGRPNPSGQSCRYIGIDNYEHDNGDDGQSLHEMWHGADFGGLVEYNGDRGVATAVGAHSRHVGMIAFKNGQGRGIYTIDDGVGFACVGTVTAGELGVDTNMELINCVSEGNLTNYSVVGSSTNTLLAVDCKSIDPVNSHYSSAANMTLIDCGHRGAGDVKKVSGSGVINIKNTEKVV